MKDGSNVAGWNTSIGRYKECNKHKLKKQRTGGLHMYRKNVSCTNNAPGEMEKGKMEVVIVGRAQPSYNLKRTANQDWE